MNSLLRWYWIGRALGWENVPRRVRFMAMRKLGAERRALPPGEVPADFWQNVFTSDYRAEDAAQHWRKRASRFFIDPERAPAIRAALPQVVDDALWQASVTDQVERLPCGELKFFDHRFHQVGWPVRFHFDPINDCEWPEGVPASQINQLDPRRQDIKCVWEASRFSVAYALAREHVRDPDSPAAALFWELFEHWDAKNPYGLSVNWSCSQEASFRFMAWLFAACATLDSPAATPARLHRLTQLVWYVARQVSFNIDYARSQKNNHALSEAAGLWTIGHLFPELRDADAWREQGRAVLIAETHRQIYDDGAYVQHSLNYHRVMLDDCLWAMRIGELVGEPLEPIAERVSKATDWLLEMVDPRTGCVPNYGPNDGSQVLPLACCAYVDFRPVAQAAHYLLHRKSHFAPGPWDEKTLWLFGSEALTAGMRVAPRAAHFDAKSGGYFTLSGPRTWGMIRALKYHDRPHQADLLHFDLWCDGENILRDGGSFHYHGVKPWPDYFMSTAAHNTLQVGNADQMIRGPRFLWFHWAAARVLRNTHSADGSESLFEAEQDGYRRLRPPVTHRRRIARSRDRYHVTDEALGAGKSELSLRWRLAPGTWQQAGNTFRLSDPAREITITINAPSGMTTQLVSGQTDPAIEGWESLHYADRQPVPTIIVRGSTTLPAKIETTIEIA
jgi:hypothetical protein